MKHFKYIVFAVICFMISSCTNNERQIKQLQFQIDSLSNRLNNAQEELKLYKTSVKTICENMEDLYAKRDIEGLRAILSTLWKYHPEEKEIEIIKSYIHTINEQQELQAQKELAEKERKKKQEEAERERQRKAEEAKAAANRVGIWSCKQYAGNGQYLYYEVEITKDANGYVAYNSGDYSETTRLTKKGNRYYWDDGSFGEYYLINGSSLKVCDQDGVIKEITATRKK